MRFDCRPLVILCALALLLTACGGGEPEEAEDFQAFEDTQSEQLTPGEHNAPPVSGDTDAQPVTHEPDEQSAPDVSDEPSATDEPAPDDTPSVPDEPNEQPAPDDTDKQDAQLLGELLPEVTAVGEGVSVGKLSYDSNPDSCTVYLPEGQAYIPFLVLSGAYGGNALLLRRDVLPEAHPFNNYGAAYEDSAIDRFLNGEYLQQLDAVKDLIRPSEILVTDADALGVSGTAVKTLTRNVFLLSCAEIGFTEIVNAGMEGAALSYFDAPEHRIAHGKNGAAASWRLRTPDAYYTSVVYGVGPDGSLGNGNAYDENGVRPALCVAPDAQAFPTADIVAGQTVYFLSRVAT